MVIMYTEAVYCNVFKDALTIFKVNMKLDVLRKLF